MSQNVYYTVSVRTVFIYFTFLLVYNIFGNTEFLFQSMGSCTWNLSQCWWDFSHTRLPLSSKLLKKRLLSLGKRPKYKFAYQVILFVYVGQCRIKMDLVAMAYRFLLFNQLIMVHLLLNGLL